MHAEPDSTHLRLVGATEDHHHATARQAVAQENRMAVGGGGLTPHDPRWVLAARAYSQLQGETLAPDRRERVMRTAQALGIRPFDANVIIAIVQDGARRRQPLGAAQPMLQLLDRPAPPESARSIWTRWLGAVVLAVIANIMLIWWLIGT